MIYITPSKTLVSKQSLERAKNFAKKTLESEDSLQKWVTSVSEKSETIRNIEDMIRISCVHSIDIKSNIEDAWGQAALLNQAFKVNNHSCKFGVEVGLKCPYALENIYKQQPVDIPSSVRLNTAIEKYNKDFNDNFVLSSKSMVDMRLRGFMERPVLNQSPEAILNQEKRLEDNFKRHIQAKIEGQLFALVPEISAKIGNEPKKTKKDHDFSLNF